MVTSTKTAEIRFSDAELALFLEPRHKSFIPVTEWAARLRKPEIKRMLAGAGVSTSSPTVARPVDHLIADLKASTNPKAKGVLAAMAVMARDLPGLIEKSETADFRIDHRGFGFARVVQIHRRDPKTSKTVRVDDFTGTSGLESVKLTDSVNAK